jgi:ketosteroid isomerase-like protein
MMPRQNVDLIRQGVEAWNKGDFEGALDVVAEDFEMDWSNSIGPLKGVYRGRDEVLTFTRSFLAAFGSLRWDPEEIIEVDESHAIVMSHVYVRGHSSGVDVDAVGAQLWTFAGGAAQRIKLYQSKAEALTAVGLQGSENA